MGIYAIREEGSGPEEEPSDVEGLQNLPSVTLGCVMHFWTNLFLASSSFCCLLSLFLI